MPIIYTQDDKWIGHYSLEADKKVMGISVYFVDEFIVRDEFLLKCLPAWKLRQVYHEPMRDMTWYVKGYKRSLILKFYFWCRDVVYWRWIIRELLYKKLKLIAPVEGDMYSWRKHFRPISYLAEGGAIIR